MTERSSTNDSTATQTPASDAAGVDRIRTRAYELYEKRGGAPGDPESDWYQAEAEIKGGEARARQ